MRLLFVHDRFGPLAGAEANLYITATEFRQREHAVAIIHGPPTGKDETGWRKTFTTTYPLASQGNAEVVRLAIKDFRPDAIYVHKMSDVAVLGALVESKVPLIHMVHDHDIYCMRSYRYNPLTRAICTRAAGPHCVFPCGASVSRNHDGGFPLKFVSYSDKKREIELNKQFNRMIVVTQFMQEELLRNGFERSRIEIHPPVPRPGDSSIRSSFSDRNLILFAGQIIRGKGVDILLKSLTRIKTRFECVILGDGSHRAYCEKLSTRLGLDGRVRFVGFVPQDELKQYYRECVAITVPSVWPEPFATIGMEAMRYALPVVAFDVGGLRDWLLDGYNGFLVPWMDEVKFAEKLEYLLNNKPVAKAMGERGLKLVEEKYDFRQYILNLECMFLRVINEVKTTASPIPSISQSSALISR